jgi:hypothetical protein
MSLFDSLPAPSKNVGPSLWEQDDEDVKALVTAEPEKSVLGKVCAFVRLASRFSFTNVYDCNNCFDELPTSHPQVCRPQERPGKFVSPHLM